ncbi:MAG: hypothetical protein R2778_07050 [Saprospiraceae bacterium]
MAIAWHYAEYINATLIVSRLMAINPLFSEYDSENNLASMHIMHHKLNVLSSGNVELAIEGLEYNSTSRST